MAFIAYPIRNVVFTGKKHKFLRVSLQVKASPSICQIGILNPKCFLLSVFIQVANCSGGVCPKFGEEKSQE
eukprot:scaffold185141_cov18-Prasinocladus_malaysianus.AAC.1